LCPEDRLKVRLNRRSDNIPTADFSTSVHMACGHAWISQRFVAFAAKDRQAGNKTVFKMSCQSAGAAAKAMRLAFPRSGACDQAFRLRRESRRKRNPFSLMKPSASFWS
jgi:hypothetical protein